MVRPLQNYTGIRKQAFHVYDGCHGEWAAVRNHIWFLVEQIHDDKFRVSCVSEYDDNPGEPYLHVYAVMPDLGTAKRVIILLANLPRDFWDVEWVLDSTL